MDKNKTLVIGASENPERYSNIAINMLRSHQQPVVAIGVKPGNVLDVSFGKDKIQFEDIDTVTLYLNPKNQESYIDYILSLHPRRIIFNPGTENPDLINKAKAAGILPVIACTLVLLSTGQY